MGRAVDSGLFTIGVTLPLYVRMNPPPIPARATTRRGRKWIIVTALVAIVLAPLLAVVISYVSYRMHNSAAIRRLETKAKQRGEPLTLVDLAAKYPPIPDDENAAAALLELWQEEEPEFWQAFLEGRRPLPAHPSHKLDPALPFLGRKAARVSRTEPLAPSALAAAETYLQSRAAHTEAVRAALRRPRCRFPVKFTDGFNALLPHLAKLKTEAGEFRLEALIATEHSDIDAAITALANATRTGNLLTSEPLLIDQLVRLACLQMALDGTERLLSRAELTSPQLDRVNAMLNEMKASGAARSSYISERAMSLSVFDLPVDGLATLASSGDAPEERADPLGYRVGMGFMTGIGLTGADRRLMLETFDQALELADKDTPAALFDSQRVFANAAAKSHEFPPKIFSALLLPALAKAPGKLAAVEARRRAALAAVAVQKWRRARNGGLPQRLDDLMPQFLPSVPLDPYADQPLRYRMLTNGFVVYSVGADLHDNAGRERPQKGPLKEYDETFIIER